MTAVEEDALRLMEQVQGSFWERQDSAPLRSVMAAEGRSWPLPPCPDPAVALADEQYDTTPLSEDACLVRGTFRTVSLDAAMADTPRRLTAVCIRRPEGLRITHLHLSEDGPAASCREEGRRRRTDPREQLRRCGSLSDRPPAPCGNATGSWRP